MLFIPTHTQPLIVISTRGTRTRNPWASEAARSGKSRLATVSSKTKRQDAAAISGEVAPLPSPPPKQSRGWSGIIIINLPSRQPRRHAPFTCVAPPPASPALLVSLPHHTTTIRSSHHRTVVLAHSHWHHCTAPQIILATPPLSPPTISSSFLDIPKALRLPQTFFPLTFLPTTLLLVRFSRLA